MESRLVPSVVQVHAGDNLQTIINHAQPGDQLVLDAGATFTGPITLPAKTGDQWITIQSSALDHLPAPGQRVGPGDASFMPKITSPGTGYPALATAPGANHFRFVGVEFMPATKDALVYDLIDLGDGTGAQNALSQVPHDLTLDQCYVHTWLDQSLKRGIALNSANTNIVNSYIAGFKVDGQDSQAISGWNGPGPFKIDNNYVEAAGENILFGGAGTSITGLIPSDIEIRNNLVSKPLAWNQNDSTTYAGTHWTVKNLLELKNAQRVTIDGNRFEHNWADAQVGYAIVLTPRGDQSGGSWVTVSNVTFTNNVLKGTAQGINILGSDDYSASQPATNIVIRNNLIDDLGASRWGLGAGGRDFQLLSGQNGGSKGVVIDHNTITSAYTIVAAEGTHSGFVFTNNIAPNGTYGIFAGGVGSGTAALNAAFPGYTFQGNVIVGADAKYYPPGNSFPSSWNDVGFVNFAGGEYHLTASSPYKGKGTNGADPGANVDALLGIVSQPVVPPPSPATTSRFVLAGFPASLTAGANGTVTVTATDANGNSVTGYRGTVHFSSNDSQAVLAADYTFTAADNGVHTFSATLKTAGTRSLTATDTTTSSITGTQAGILVHPAPASGLTLGGFPNSVSAGTAASFSVTATDPYGNTATDYRGTVNFSSDDSQAALPGTYSFASTDNGVHSFSATLNTAGTRSLTATDSKTNALKGTESAITVNASSTPGPGSSLPNVTYHGGPLLQHVQVESVYYGQAWGSDTNLQQQIGQVDGFLQYFTSSPYMDVLKQYNVEHGTFVDHDVVAHDPTGGKTVDDSQIRALLSSEIAAQHLGAPTADRLYVFFTAPGVTVTANGKSSVQDFAGYHSAFTTSTGVSVYYAVVPYPTGTISSKSFTAFQQDTIILSHEVSEAITNPDTWTGWFDSKNGEIGDIAEGQFGTLHGYVVQGVWSQADGKVVLPADTSSTTLHVTGTEVRATAGQAITGLVATITGADPKATTASFTATIDWGNGTTTAGTITADSKGGFDVNGSNIYTEPGAFTVTITVRDQQSVVLGKALTKVNVSPAPPTVEAKGAELWATAGKEFSGVVATFTDSRPAAVAGDFDVTIHWGDGTSSTGMVTGNTKDGFHVNGSHTYANAHNSWAGLPFGGQRLSGSQFFMINVTIHDNPANATATVRSVAKVVGASSTKASNGQNLTLTNGHLTQVAGTFTQVHASASITSNGATNPQTALSIHTGSATRVNVTGSPSSATAGRTGSSTVAAPAPQKHQAVTGLVQTIAAVADNGLPTSKASESPPSQLVSFTSAPGVDQTSAHPAPEESNTPKGTNRTPAPVLGLPFGQASTDLEPSFWLD